MESRSYDWDDLPDEHREFYITTLARMMPGHDPVVEWEHMPLQHRREWLWNREHPLERDGWTFEKELARLTDAADAETVQVFRALPPIGDYQDDDDPFWIDFAQPITHTDDLVEGLILPGRWLQLAASAKAGKSSLLLFIAIELSEGRSPLDGTPIPPISVVWLDGEMGRADLEDLIADCGHDPLQLTNLHCSDRDMQLDGFNDSTELFRHVGEVKAKLVILDGLNSFVSPGAAEKDDSTWRPLFDVTIQPLKRQGIAVVSADNMGHEHKQRPRGSSVKLDKADAVVTVGRTEKGVRLTATHARAGAYIDRLELEAEGFDRSRPIRYWRSRLDGWPHGTTDVAKTLDSLGVPRSTGRRKARQLLNQRRDEAIKQGLDPEPYKVDTTVLAAALRWRKSDINVSAALVGDDPAEDTGQDTSRHVD